MGDELLRKTVSFSNEEMNLYSHWEENIYKKTGEKFASYVKRLMREDIDKESLDQQIEQKIKEFFSNSNIMVDKIEEVKEKPVYDEKAKNALLGFMKK